MNLLAFISTMMSCMMLNTYHEARGESIDGQLQVMQVVFNRVADDRWPDDVCSVIRQPDQFSWTSDELSDEPNEEELAKMIEDLLIKSRSPVRFPTANHYHHKDINPWWNRDMEYLGTIGNHKFYKG